MLYRKLFLSFIILEAIQRNAICTQNFQHLIKLHSMSSKDRLRFIKKSSHLFHNKTLRVCVVVREPFVFYNDPHPGANKTKWQKERDETDFKNYSGIAIEIIKFITELFKFKIRTIRPRDNEFGVLLPGSGWTGLTGMLVRNETDIGVTGLSITSSRSQVIDFTRPYYFETTALLLRTPDEIRNYWAVFEPFSVEVWALLLAFIIALIFLITVMTRLEESQSKRHRVHKLIKFIMKSSNIMELSGENSANEKAVQSNELSERYSRMLHRGMAPNDQMDMNHEMDITWLDRFYYAVTCVLNILLIRDIKHPPTQTPIRIMVCVWWLATIVIVNIYLGVLFGQLVLPRRRKAIDTLDELVNQKQVKWCVTKGSAIYEIFRDSPPETVFGKIGKRMETVQSADEGFRRVLEAGWAFIRERSILIFKMAAEHTRLKACKTQFAKEKFFAVGFGLGLPKNSPYTDPINSALYLMFEEGFISRWQARYWPTSNQYTECRVDSLREGEPLSMKHFISIYLVCSCIVLCAALILAYQSVHVYLFEPKILPLYLRFRQRMRKSSPPIASSE